MKRMEIAKLYTTNMADGQSVTVCGWARTVRDSKSIGFIELADGSSFKTIQIVFQSEKLANYADIAKCGVGTSVQIEGKIVLTPDAKQPFEINADNIRVLGTCPPEYPLQKKRHTLEFLRTMPHLRGRTNLFTAAYRVRSASAFAVHKFFNELGFLYVHTPIITGSDCEGAGEMFRVTTLDAIAPPLDDNKAVDYKQDFFGTQANLTVSGQLEGEAMATALGNIYTFGPTFRAENSNTPRHAAEFWMIEPEMVFCDLSGFMDTAEAMVKYMINHLLENCADELAFFNAFVDKELLSRLQSVANSDFGRITYTEAVALLEPHNSEFQYKVSWGCDLQTEHERYLTEQIYKKPLFVTDYPKDIKSFYMRLNDDGKTVAAADMLVPGVGELIGGSQREERLDVLLQIIAEKGLKAEDYDWYLDTRRFGTVEHAGYGLGFDRFLMYATGISNIRDMIPFPRTATGF